MVDNIDKVTQRGDKLEDLGERAGEGGRIARTPLASSVYSVCDVPYIIHGEIILQLTKPAKFCVLLTLLQVR